VANLPSECRRTQATSGFVDNFDVSVQATNVTAKEQSLADESCVKFSMSESSTHQKMKNLLTDAFLIAIGTALLYLIAFFYEWGYCSYFEIPSNFISPNTSTVLVAAGAIGSFFTFSIQLFGFAVPLLRAGTNPTEKQRPYREVFLINALLLILGFVLLKAYGFYWQGALLFALLVALLNFIFFGIGLLVYRKHGSIANRLQAIRADQQNDSFDAWALIQEKIGRTSTLSVIAFISILGIAFVIGNGEAARQQRFLMINDSPTFAVLRVYGELVIAGEVDSSKKEIGPGLMLFRTSTEKPLRLSAELAGPLSSKALTVHASRVHAPPAVATSYSPVSSASMAKPASSSSASP